MKPGISAADLPVKPLSGVGPWFGPALLFFAVILQVLSFPGELLVEGFAPAAWLVLAPLSILFQRMRLRTLPLWGAAWGLATSLSCLWWLGSYHPLALLIAAAFAMPFYALVFWWAGSLQRLSGQWFMLLGPVLWVACEYLRSQGFLAMPYLILAYSQYNVDLLRSSVAWAGIWPLSLLLAGFAFIVGDLLAPWPTKQILWLRRHTVASSAWGLLLLLTLAGGLVAQVDTSDSPRLRLALVQHNMDPWIGGDAAYRRNFTALRRLSETVLDQQADLLVWSETAFIPAIEYHLRYRESGEREELVRDLLGWLQNTDVPVLFGQNHAERRLSEFSGLPERVDYNSAVLYQQGQLLDRYDKRHLVPFSEYFPYRRELPGVWQWLKENRTNFWEPGTRTTIFQVKGVSFATPICFEDSFPEISREFVDAGADVLVNISNDTWSFSKAAMMQHLAMAVFRAAENRRSMVRATNGGVTAFIGPDGKILSRAPLFQEAVLVDDLPVYRGERLSFAWIGDSVGLACLVLACLSTLGLLLWRAFTGRLRWPSIVDSPAKKSQYGR